MKGNLTIPIAILLGALFVAGALFVQKFSRDEEILAQDERLQQVELLREDDHYLGNPKAKLVIVEYSDYDCSFCAGHFSNLKRIVEDIGKNGSILWIHRHMPLTQIHETAREKAIFAECSALSGGEDIFWEISEILYASLLNGETVEYDAISSNLSLDGTAVKKCMDDGAIKEKITAQYNEAYNAGARGTPFTVIIDGDKRYAIAESLPYLELRTMVETFLNDGLDSIESYNLQ